MQHKWLKAALFTGAVALGLVGGQLNHVSAAADTDVPASMTFSQGAFAANTDGAGYMMVRQANGSLNYMISDSFKDSLGNYAYCLESERPTPIGQTGNKGSIGSDAQYRLFKYGFNNHPASDQGYWGISGLTDQEAWYATQTVSWILAGNFNWNQIVWQASQPGDFADGIYAPYGEAAVNRVKAAATKVYNNVMNNSDTANTTMTLAAQGATDVQGYHKFTYTVQSNQAGTATLNFKNQVAGMKVVDANGNAIANNTVTIGQAFSLLIPDSTPTGDLTFDINGNIKAIVPVIYNDAAQKYQDSISLVTGVVKPLLAGNKAKWTRAAGLIKVHKVDQDGKALAGAEFTLTDDLGNKQSVTTDQTGNAQFSIFGARTYSLEETKTPAGYQGSFKQTGITLTKDGQTFEYTAKNTLEKGIVKIHKVDQNGKALAGVEFTLTDNLGSKQTAVTDQDGNAQFNIVANRTYSLKETKTLAGYTGSFQKDGITLDNDGQAFSYTAVNAEDVTVHTTATSNGQKSVDANKQMTIDDVVHATGLIVGKTYTVKGQLYDKATGKALIFNGKPVTAETTFVAKASVQDVTVHFAFDGSELGGHDVVVFEDLYLGNKKIASHADLNDKGQTVHVTTPKTPETPVTPVTPSTPSTPAPKPVAYQAKMPQTGDAHDNVLAALGVALVALVSGFAGFKIYKKRQA
ncbi:VaFE repeat-containing surface-anchored protein [Lacticaseibacillus paracasei]|uniref:SpaA isopeptide-forming pilin-related protein n=1 Tax=Lacticaseibacillus paracasei TaxID=1597 RepID=UPI001BA8EC1E|nr:VaFE repeat-containing surface-anchored protein [Lacticaseibacillus paracasei]MBS0992699.1 VaFE repeat-containing surface-anchored protein [Lacticaseibacillus paracasei]